MEKCVLWMLSEINILYNFQIFQNDFIKRWAAMLKNVSNKGIKLQLSPGKLLIHTLHTFIISVLFLYIVYLKTIRFLV